MDSLAYQEQIALGTILVGVVLMLDGLARWIPKKWQPIALLIVGFVSIIFGWTRLYY